MGHLRGLSDKDEWKKKTTKVEPLSHIIFFRTSYAHYIISNRSYFIPPLFPSTIAALFPPYPTYYSS
ncbi:hypothetical protein OMK64_20195, partial [Cellulomonas fimi]|nr:hypothetical protein [Cellulomonas fimi]